MKAVFANVTHGFVYAHNITQSEGMIFTRFSINDYVKYFKNLDADILCLSEVLIDSEDKQSEFIEKLTKECGLNYYESLINEKSWIYDGRFYGMAILSKYKISNYEEFLLPNPKFEVDRPNGDHWILHDKYAQFCNIEISGKVFNIFNLHYFPVHHFKRKLSDVEMKDSKEKLTNFFISKNSNNPTLIFGDFNNKHGKLVTEFPELFKNNLYAESIETETTIVDGVAQLDHILYNPASIKIKSGKAEKFLSDHYCLIIEFDLI